jgi:hypothetical protein
MDYSVILLPIHAKKAGQHLIHSVGIDFQYSTYNIYSYTGFFTGNCVSIQKNTRKSVCEISAWCPQELSNST